ncbi:hypothetical protein DFP73DRAFT_630974 [Morchella snyderi]|nr:hypothetical protein DFP73DRAFT_630974 [Morchella snyderi]
MRLSSLFLLAGASLVSAQWGDYLNRVLGTQKPLAASVEEVDQHIVIERRVRNITSENWRSSINNTAVTEGSDVAETAEEWYFYFTTSNINGTRNATKWDGVFEETTVQLAATQNLAGPAPKINLGRIDCASPEATELCQTFLLTSQGKLPEVYHIASFANGTVEIREVPWPAELIDGEQAAHLVKFHTEAAWKNVGAWSGILNPIDGALKDFVVPYISTAMMYYETLPPWVMMVTISFLGRTIMSRITRGVTTTPPRAPAPAAGSS